MARVLHGSYVEEVATSPEYKSLRNLMDKSETLDQFDIRVNGASGLQVKLFVEYKNYQREQEKQRCLAREEQVSANRIIQRNILPYAVRRQYITRNGKRVLVFRDRQTGRFISKVRRMKA